ncbi:MAG TPA: RnfABCDGE type electron transport complex subunit B [Bacillota bacterium]|jgi:electron transport complex protein RnfB|nr:RnfABCDGE type electron transport complex subunit B [Bacillota bacterium]
MSSLNALLSMGAMGLIFGISLGAASKKLAVEQDPRIDQIMEVLPGANCGGCGFAGCSALAGAIVSGDAPVTGCPVGKSAVAEKIAKIMGVECATTEPKHARVLCRGSRKNAAELYEYRGLQDCRSAQLTGGGAKVCTYGCLGFGSCVAACQFGAMSMGPDGLPVVDDSLCTGCGKCVGACPRGLIELRAAGESVDVVCKSHARGPVVRQACSVGCIGCGLCARNCPEKAIEIVNNLAVIDQAKCTRCGICIEKCPQKCIVDSAGVEGITPAKKDEAAV